MDFVKINQLRNGMSAVGFYLVKTAAVKMSASGKSQYGDYTLADETGEINAKIWDVAEPELCPKAGSIIKVQGLANEYQGRLQFRIDKFRDAAAGDPVDPAALVPSAPQSGEELYDAVTGYATRIGQEKLALLVLQALEENRERLLVWPAAVKNHHSVRAGLLYHTHTMLRNGEAMMRVYDFLRADYIYAGAILHDIAKLFELDATPTGIATEYTRDGMLLGHIIQGIVYVEKLAAKVELDPAVTTLLQHMLLSHHYEPEYGSPRRPMFPEAEILHYLDIIDSRMYDMQKALESVAPGGFSERLWTLHNRQLYRLTEQEIAAEDR